MEANKILNADVLDIIFEGRNKDYGAYNLRKTYDRRLIASMSIMVSILLVSFAGYVFAGKINATDSGRIYVKDIVLVLPPEPKVLQPPLPVPPPALQLPKVETVKFTSPPRIVEDDQVKQSEMPPEVETLADTKIGVINQDGIKDDNITAPPVSDGKRGIVEAPQKTQEEIIFTRVEIESAYPGGAGAWMRYLNKTFKYPEEAQTIDVQGTVVVQFIVDQEGNVSNVEVVSGPTLGGLGEEAIRVIKRSGKWEPASQNGRKVKSYKKQPIIFRLNTE